MLYAKSFSQDTAEGVCPECRGRRPRAGTGDCRDHGRKIVSGINSFDVLLCWIKSPSAAFAF